MKGMMADGRELRDDDPRLDHLKRAAIEGPLDPSNPAANIPPADLEGVEAIASLITQGIQNEVFVGMIRSTLGLNLCRLELGRKNVAIEPVTYGGHI